MKYLMKLFLVVNVIFSVTNTYSMETVSLATGEWLPYSSKKELKHNGIALHIATAAFEKESIKVNYQYLPWKRGYEYGKRGIVDGATPWALTTERQIDYYFSEPILYVTKVLFYKKGLIFDWKTVDDLKKYKVGITLGYTYGYEFDKAVKEKKFAPVVVNYDKENILYLSKGVIDIFPMDRIVGYFNINKYLTKELADQITHHPKPIMAKTPVCVMLSKAKKEKSLRLVQLFNSGLQKLKKSGEYDLFLQNFQDGKYDINSNK